MSLEVSLGEVFEKDLCILVIFVPPKEAQIVSRFILMKINLLINILIKICKYLLFKLMTNLLCRVLIDFIIINLLKVLRDALLEAIRNVPRMNFYWLRNNFNCESNSLIDPRNGIP